MKNYVEYIVDDFIQDLNFREWVLEPTTESTQFWEEWLIQHPEKKEIINQAKTIVANWPTDEADINDEDINKGIDRILLLIEPVAAPIIPFYKSSWFRIAASIALLLTAGFWWVNRSGVGENPSQNTVYTEGVSNKEDKSLLVNLPDGSTVVLAKNSEIQYAKDFAGQLREVKFKGEGLFDVVENPNKPFWVHTGNVTTKVLGTSFVVKAFDKEEKVTVDVIRGKVSVTVDKQTKKDVSENNALILVPNQKAVFTKSVETLERTLSEKPIVIADKDTTLQMVFEEAPVNYIFEKLENTYGVDIVYNKEIFKNCAMTITFEDEPLFEKLNVICKGIGAKYKVVDVQILVEGKPCQ
jgi:transmembrane sensor